jgi:hypothetical protein
MDDAAELSHTYRATHPGPRGPTATTVVRWQMDDCNKLFLEKAENWFRK